MVLNQDIGWWARWPSHWAIDHHSSNMMIQMTMHFCSFEACSLSQFLSSNNNLQLFSDEFVSVSQWFFFLSIHTSDNRWRHMICLSWYWEWNSILPFVRVKFSIFSFNVFFNYPHIGVVSCVPSDSCVAASSEISFCGPQM